MSKQQELETSQDSIDPILDTFLAQVYEDSCDENRVVRAVVKVEVYKKLIKDLTAWHNEAQDRLIKDIEAKIQTMKFDDTEIVALRTAGRTISAGSQYSVNLALDQVLDTLSSYRREDDQK